MPKRSAYVAGICTSNQWMTQTRSGNAHHSALSPRRVLPFCPLARLGAPFVMDVRIGAGVYAAPPEPWVIGWRGDREDWTSRTSRAPLDLPITLRPYDPITPITPRESARPRIAARS